MIVFESIRFDWIVFLLFINKKLVLNLINLLLLSKSDGQNCDAKRDR